MKLMNHMVDDVMNFKDMKFICIDEISWFRCNGKRYYFKIPIKIEIRKDNEYWICNKELDIWGMGITIKKCINDFRISLMRIYSWKFEHVMPIPRDVPQFIEKIDNMIDWERSNV